MKLIHLATFSLLLALSALATSGTAQVTPGSLQNGGFEAGVLETPLESVNVE